MSVATVASHPTSACRSVKDSTRKNPADGNGDADSDGYTNLEEQLHSLTE
jgi:hypothetical protein